MIKLANSIEINAPKEEGINFLANLDENYELIDPDHHIKGECLTGKPIEEGSILYFEEYLNGQLSKVKCKIEELNLEKRVVARYLFPHSLLGVKMVFEIDEREDHFLLTEKIIIGYELQVIDKLVDVAAKFIFQLVFGSDWYGFLQDHSVSGLEKIKELLEMNNKNLPKSL